LAGVDETDLLLAELALQPLRGGVHLPPQHGRIQVPPQRQHLGEQLGGDGVGGHRGELGLQVDQFRGAALGQQHRERSERPGSLGLAVAVPPAGAGQAQGAEQGAQHDGVLILVSPRLPGSAGRPAGR